MGKYQQYHSLKELMEDFQSGRERALEAIYTTHSRAIYSFTLRLVQEEGICDEIVAESFFRLWNKRQQFDSIKGLVSYLYTIARHLCYEHQQTEKKRKAVLEEVGYLSSIDEDSVCEEMRSRLLQAIYIEAQQMPEQMKKVFMLAYLEGMQTPAIAREMAVSVNTVNTHKKAALKRVRAALAKKGFTKWSYLLNLLITWWC